MELSGEKRGLSPLLTFTFPRFFSHLTNDNCVRNDDNQQWHAIYGDQIKEVVCQFVCRGWKEVESNALREPWEFWMDF